MRDPSHVRLETAALDIGGRPRQRILTVEECSNNPRPRRQLHESSISYTSANLQLGGSRMAFLRSKQARCNFLPMQEFPHGL